MAVKQILNSPSQGKWTTPAAAAWNTWAPTVAWTVSATASCRASAPAVVGMTQRGYGTKMGGRWVEHGLKIGYIRDTVIRNDSTCWDDLNIYILIIQWGDITTMPAPRYQKRCLERVYKYIPKWLHFRMAGRWTFVPVGLGTRWLLPSHVQAGIQECIWKWFCWRGRHGTGDVWLATPPNISKRSVGVRGFFLGSWWA